MFLAKPFTTDKCKRLIISAAGNQPLKAPLHFGHLIAILVWTNHDYTCICFYHHMSNKMNIDSTSLNKSDDYHFVGLILSNHHTTDNLYSFNRDGTESS